jgi:hypothetical protein
MKYVKQMKKIALCVGVVVLQLEASVANADSANGVDTALGNALNPPGRNGIPRQVDPDGVDAVRRSPTGQLYGVPYAESEQTKNPDSWNFSGGAEVGVIGVDGQGRKGSPTAQQFRQYKDIKNGAYLNYFEVEGSKPNEARFMDSFGGGVGAGDQFYGLQVGRYNDWKVKVFYNETTHVFTDTWKSLYNGEGTGNLTTGLAMPTMVTSGAKVSGVTANYIGASATCSPTAPCWAYNGKTYGNAIALAAINGVTGTPNAITGAIANTAASPTATGATQSNLAAAINAKLAATPYSELSLVRQKGGVRGDKTLTDSVKVFASYTLEDRKGGRPLAMNDGNVSSEIVEPINYNTHDFLTGLTYQDERNQANLKATASIFKNNISTQNVQYMLLGSAGPQGAIQTATLDLPPDNQAFNVKGEFARSLPDFYKGRFTVATAYGVNKQNDPLLSPISAAQNADLTAAGVTSWPVATPGGYASTLASNWNTVNALSRQNAGQEIDSKLFNTGLSLKPVSDLTLNATYRFYQTTNKGGYMAYNPLTGQFGRGPSTGNGTGASDLVIAPNGVNTGCYAPVGFAAVAACNAAAAQLANGSNIPVFGQARETKQVNYVLSADYDLNRFSSLNGSLEREDFNRTFRERDNTTEYKAKVGYVNRALGDATLRTSFENDTKRGSTYNYRTFEDLGTGLPGLDPATQIANLNANGTGKVVNGVTYPALNANLFNRYSYFMRKYDQADRNQNILNTRVNYQARDDLDVGVNLQFKRIDYTDSFYGLKKDNQDSIGFDLNYQPSSTRSITSFYNYQKGTKTQYYNVGLATTGTSAAAACTVANLSLYGYSACSDTTTGVDGPRPAGSQWDSETTDRNDVVGLGWQEDFGFVKLGVDYVFARSSTNIIYKYGNQAFQAGQAASTGVSANQTTLNNNFAASVAGNALPDMTTIQNTLVLNLTKPIDKQSSVRLLYRYEQMKITDWHYDNVITGVLTAADAGTLLLDAGPQNYHATLAGLFYQIKL